MQTEITKFIAKEQPILFTKAKRLYSLYKTGQIKFSCAIFTLEQHLENIIQEVLDFSVRGLFIENKSEQEKYEYKKDLKSAIDLLDMELKQISTTN